MSGVAPEARGDTAGERACRICGCTEYNACVDPHGYPCRWIEADLCSHCIYAAIVAKPRPRAAFDGAGAVGVVRGHA